MSRKRAENGGDGECFMQVAAMKIQSRKTQGKPGQSKSWKKKNPVGIGRGSKAAKEDDNVGGAVRHGLKYSISRWPGAEHFKLNHSRNSLSVGKISC